MAEMSGNGREIKNFSGANDVPTFSLRQHGAASNTAIDTNEPREASDGGNERKWSGNKKFQMGERRSNIFAEAAWCRIQRCN